jgi:hypothetical protein
MHVGHSHPPLGMRHNLERGSKCYGDIFTIYSYFPQLLSPPMAVTFEIFTKITHLIDLYEERRK